MQDFPREKLKPIFAKLSGVDGNLSLEVFLEQFELSCDDYSEKLESSIKLDGINIPSTPKEIEGKIFYFSVNPEDGYIDGSIYFFSTHNPVDVTKILFGKIHNSKLPIKLETTWVLEFEKTGFKNFETEIETYIKL